jgi:hypothetical protein
MSECRWRPPLVLLASLLLTTGFTDQPSASLRISLDRTACAAIDEMSVHISIDVQNPEPSVQLAVAAGPIPRF